MASSDHVYYQGTITNSNQYGDTLSFSPLQFVDSRTADILTNADDYYFSIIRFTMNGPGRLLPLWLPIVQTNQTNVNLTVYGLQISYQQTWEVSSTTHTFTINMPYTYMIFSPENQNPTQAPTPRAPIDSSVQGVYSGTVGYKPGQIVGTAGSYSNAVAPFYTCVEPSTDWVSGGDYTAGAYVSYGGNAYTLTGTSTISLPPPEDTGNWTAGAYGLGTSSSAFTPTTLVTGVQDLTTSYYYGYTYSHFCDLLNQTLLAAHEALFTQFQTEWGTVFSSGSFPFANFAAFQTYVQTPQLLFNQDSSRFYYVADTSGYGARVVPWSIETFGSATTQSNPVFTLYQNTDLNGMLGNFYTTYVNTTGSNAYQILFPSLPLSTNVLDLTVYPGGTGGFVPTNQSRYWRITEQDFPSTSDLWSPVSAIVFTTSLIGTKSELESAPQQVGTASLQTSGAGFSQVVTDTALDLSQGGAQYKQFFFYSPASEYRLLDVKANTIKDVNLYVYWKCRLNGQLYPIQLYNNSSCGVKILFRKKTVFGGKAD